MELKVISYKCRKLPKSRCELALRPDINSLFNQCSIPCLQEIWYTKQNIKYLDNLHNEFIGIGTARYDDTGGLCNAKYESPFETNSDWCNAIELQLDSRRVIILDVYMVHQCNNNREAYTNCSGAIKSLIDEFPTSSFIIVGD